MRRWFGLALAMSFFIAGSSDARDDGDDRASGTGPVYAQPGWYVGGGGNFALLDSGSLSHPENGTGSRGFGPGANMRAGYRFANRLAIEFESNWMRHQDVGRTDFLRLQSDRVTEIEFFARGSVPGRTLKLNDPNQTNPTIPDSGFNRRGKIFGLGRVPGSSMFRRPSVAFTANADCPGQPPGPIGTSGVSPSYYVANDTDGDFIGSPSTYPIPGGPFAGLIITEQFYMCGPLPEYWFTSGAVQAAFVAKDIFDQNRTFFFDGDSLEAKSVQQARCVNFPTANANPSATTTDCRGRARNPKANVKQFPPDSDIKVRSDTLALTLNIRGYLTTDEGWPAMLGPFSGMVKPETLQAMSLWGRIQPYAILGAGLGLTQIHSTFLRTTNRDTFFEETSQDIGAQPFCSFRDILGNSYGPLCTGTEHSFPAGGLVQSSSADETDATILFKGGLGVDLYATKKLAVSVEARFVWLEGFGNVPIDLSVGLMYRFH